MHDKLAALGRIQRFMKVMEATVQDGGASQFEILHMAKHTGRRDDGFPVTSAELRLDDLKVLFQTLITELEEETPEDPFIGDELSGGPACIGCHSDSYNADHDHPQSKCTWVRRRTLLANLKQPDPAPRFCECLHNQKGNPGISGGHCVRCGKPPRKTDGPIL